MLCRMGLFVKNLNTPDWIFEISGIVDADFKAHMMAEGLFDGGFVYQGQWHHGVKQGSGVFVWPDGQRYRGTLLHGKRHGMGVQHTADGEEYEGEWKDDQKHGVGAQSQPSGHAFLGEYRSGRRVYGVHAWPGGKMELSEYDEKGREIMASRIRGLNAGMLNVNYCEWQSH